MFGGSAIILDIQMRELNFLRLKKKYPHINEKYIYLHIVLGKKTEEEMLRAVNE